MCQWKDLYKDELKRRIDAWEGKVAEDFQYEPDRPLLKNEMKEWLAGQMPDADEKRLLLKTESCLPNGWPHWSMRKM